jgi:hypothetical protein
MKFKLQNRELTLEVFKSSLEGLSKSNCWVKLDDALSWDKIEKIYNMKIVLEDTGIFRNRSQMAEKTLLLAIG